MESAATLPHSSTPLSRKWEEDERVGHLGGQVLQEREDLQVGLQLGLQVVVGVPVLQLAGQSQTLVPVGLHLTTSKHACCLLCSGTINLLHHPPPPPTPTTTPQTLTPIYLTTSKQACCLLCSGSISLLRHNPFTHHHHNSNTQTLIPVGLHLTTGEHAHCFLWSVAINLLQPPPPRPPSTLHIPDTHPSRTPPDHRWIRPLFPLLCGNQSHTATSPPPPLHLTHPRRSSQ